MRKRIIPNQALSGLIHFNVNFPYMTAELLLIAGLSNAGKSDFADLIENEQLATHIPLDKYFFSVPKGMVFLDWVQYPESIDWKLLDDHLGILTSGSECFSPAYDHWGSGKRLSKGGFSEHPESRLMIPRDKYVVPGCLAFEYPGVYSVASRIFIETELETIAFRHAMRKIEKSEVHKILSEKITSSYPKILQYSGDADFIFSGEATKTMRKEYIRILEKKLERKLAR